MREDIFKLFITPDMRSAKGMLLLDVEEGRERLQIRRFDENDAIENMELGEGYGSYSTQESVNRFITLCRGGHARNCGDHVVGSKTVQVLKAMYESISTGDSLHTKRKMH